MKVRRQNKKNNQRLRGSETSEVRKTGFTKADWNDNKKGRTNFSNDYTKKIDNLDHHQRQKWTKSRFLLVHIHLSKFCLIITILAWYISFVCLSNCQIVDISINSLYLRLLFSSFTNDYLKQENEFSLGTQIMKHISVKSTGSTNDALVGWSESSTAERLCFFI